MTNIYAHSISFSMFIGEPFQVIHLHAGVFFPEVKLMVDTLNLGDVVTGFNTQAAAFSLSNPSLADADWRIVTDATHLQTAALAASGTPPKFEPSYLNHLTWWTMN
jgi:hypothetical protein